MHSICSGLVYSKEDFLHVISADERIVKNFKFSIINVQDPIEWSHNVASNISKQNVQALKIKLAFSIKAIKNDHENIIGLFQLDKIQAECSNKSKRRYIGRFFLNFLYYLINQHSSYNRDRTKILKVIF